MNSNHQPTPTVLVIENDVESVDLISRTLSEAGVHFTVAATDAEGWDAARTEPTIKLIICRMQADQIDGCQFARRVRAIKPTDQVQLLMIVTEVQLQDAGLAIKAGANDVLIAPFEARELRMLANLQPARDNRRIDAAHQLENGQVTVAIEAEQQQAQQQMQVETEVRFIRPTFDFNTMKYTYHASVDQIREWQSDDRVTQVVLDNVLVCPECEAVPTFRHGCGNCGSAVIEQERLLHHFACAYVGTEKEFRADSRRFSCPKCLQTDLVVGADFEVTSGPFRCADCGEVVNTASLIGHCVCCEHRFIAAEAMTMPLYGFYVYGVRNVETEATRIPGAPAKTSAEPSMSRRAAGTRQTISSR